MIVMNDERSIAERMDGASSTRNIADILLTKDPELLLA
jgi:hypothetical protein